MDLNQLIAIIESDASDDPLERVTAAAGLKDHIEQLGDELLDHFVKDARDNGCSWNQIGEALGVTRQAAQQRHGGLLGRIVEGLTAGRFQRFTPRARASVVAAQTIARDRGHEPIGTEHVLLGMYAAGGGNLATVALERLGVDPDAIEHLVDERRPRGTSPIRGHVRFGADAKTALEGALASAVELGHNYIGCEHLLLGICQVDSLGAQALADQGVTYDDLRPVVEALVGEVAGGGGAA